MASSYVGQHAFDMTARQRLQPLNQVLGQNIRVYRAAKGLSQEDLAEKAGIKRTYVGAVERGEVDPRLGTLSKIAAGLNIEAFKLLVPATDQLAMGLESITGRPRS